MLWSFKTQMCMGRHTRLKARLQDKVLQFFWQTDRPVCFLGWSALTQAPTLANAGLNFRSLGPRARRKCICFPRNRTSLYFHFQRSLTCFEECELHACLLEDTPGNKGVAHCSKQTRNACVQRYTHVPSIHCARLHNWFLAMIFSASLPSGGGRTVFASALFRHILSKDMLALIEIAS